MGKVKVVEKTAPKTVIIENSALLNQNLKLGRQLISCIKVRRPDQVIELFLSSPFDETYTLVIAQVKKKWFWKTREKIMCLHLPMLEKGELVWQCCVTDLELVPSVKEALDSFLKDSAYARAVIYHQSHGSCQPHWWLTKSSQS